MRLSCILQIIARSIMIYNEAERRVIYCNTECYNLQYTTKAELDNRFIAHNEKKRRRKYSKVNKYFHKQILHKIIPLKDF